MEMKNKMVLMRLSILKKLSISEECSGSLSMGYKKIVH